MGAIGDKVFTPTAQVLWNKLFNSQIFADVVAWFVKHQVNHEWYAKPANIAALHAECKKRGF